MPCHHVDVNLHPTKKEVGFVHQEEVVEALRQVVEKALLSSNSSRTFVQQTLPSHAAFAPPPLQQGTGSMAMGQEEEGCGVGGGLQQPAKPELTTKV